MKVSKNRIKLPARILKIMTHRCNFYSSAFSFYFSSLHFLVLTLAWKVLVEPSKLLESNLHASRISGAFQILRQVKTSMEAERECDFDHLNQPDGLSWL